MSTDLTNDSIDKSLDIIGAPRVEIEISDTGHVMWVETDYGCKLRIAHIKELILTDNRQRTERFAIECTLNRGGMDPINSSEFKEFTSSNAFVGWLIAKMSQGIVVNIVRVLLRP